MSIPTQAETHHSSDPASPLPHTLAQKWMPIILEERCTGCGACVDACGPKSLALAEEIAILALPDTCGSEEHCISVCPEDAIQMTWQPYSGNRGAGKWQDGSCVRRPITSFQDQ